MNLEIYDILVLVTYPCRIVLNQYFIFLCKILVLVASMLCHYNIRASLNLPNNLELFIIRSKSTLNNATTPRSPLKEYPFTIESPYWNRPCNWQSFHTFSFMFWFFFSNIYNYLSILNLGHSRYFNLQLFWPLKLFP